VLQHLDEPVQKLGAAVRKTVAQEAEHVRLLGTSAARRSWGEVVALAEAERAEPNLTPELSAWLKGVREQGGHLQALQELHTTIARPKLAVDMAAVEKHLARLPAGPERDLLAADVRRYLRCRAHLTGEPAAAARLLPGDASPNADSLLRDLKAVASNEPAPPTLSPGVPAVSVLEPLPLPEADPLGIRPNVKETLGADLPKMQEVVTAEKAARARLLGQLNTNAQVSFHHFQVHLAMMASRGHSGHRLDGGMAARVSSPEEDRRNETEVAKRLEREITAPERLLINHLNGKKTAEELATMLRQLDQPRKGQ